MTIMDELREATRVDHDAIEGLLGLMADDISLSKYVRTLERFYGYYEPLECRLYAIPGMTNLIADLEHRRKVPLLKRDLEHWGCHEQILPRCTSLPPLDNTNDALGCLYVLEGATLGGRILTRYFTGRLGILDHAGGSFFAGYGERTGAMWQALGRSIVAIPFTEAESTRIIQCARATFRTLQNWSTENFQ